MNGVIMRVKGGNICGWGSGTMQPKSGFPMKYRPWSQMVRKRDPMGLESKVNIQKGSRGQEHWPNPLFPSNHPINPFLEVSMISKLQYLITKWKRHTFRFRMTTFKHTIMTDGWRTIWLSQVVEKWHNELVCDWKGLLAVGWGPSWRKKLS